MVSVSFGSENPQKTQRGNVGSKEGGEFIEGSGAGFGAAPVLGRVGPIQETLLEW